MKKINHFLKKIYCQIPQKVVSCCWNKITSKTVKYYEKYDGI